MLGEWWAGKANELPVLRSELTFKHTSYCVEVISQVAGGITRFCVIWL